MFSRNAYIHTDRQSTEYRGAPEARGRASFDQQFCFTMYSYIISTSLLLFFFSELLNKILFSSFFIIILVYKIVFMHFCIHDDVIITQVIYNPSNRSTIRVSISNHVCKSERELRIEQVPQVYL